MGQTSWQYIIGKLKDYSEALLSWQAQNRKRNSRELRDAIQALKHKQLHEGADISEEIKDLENMITHLLEA